MLENGERELPDESESEPGRLPYDDGRELAGESEPGRLLENGERELPDESEGDDPRLKGDDELPDEGRVPLLPEP